MDLKLVKGAAEYRAQICSMLDEWYAAGESIIPFAIRRTDHRQFDAYLASLDSPAGPDGAVPDSTYFCLDCSSGLIVGAVNIRHRLNERLLLDGGHIGDGVRPSQRGKGVATRMIALALEKCRELGITRVLMVCEKQNPASAGSIRNNGGVLENEVVVDGVVKQRYWISNET